MKHKRVCAKRLPFIEKAWMALFLLAFAGCVINFEHRVPAKGMRVDVHYLYPGRNEFSSRGKFYKKQIAPGRFAQTNSMELDPEQQLLVLNKAFEFHFYQMPDSFYHTDYPAGAHPAGSPQFIKISVDTLDKTVRWSGSLGGLQPAGYHLKELVEYVDSIVKSTDAYRALPSN